jgi:predicted Zn finger-like uncharacterized protein
MLSRCPACATVFRVDTVQIRAREGRVRCGRCHAVFDALDAMVDITAARTTTAAGGTQPSVPPAAFDPARIFDTHHSARPAVGSHAAPNVFDIATDDLQAAPIDPAAPVVQPTTAPVPEDSGDSPPPHPSEHGDPPPRSALPSTEPTETTVVPASDAIEPDEAIRSETDIPGTDPTSRAAAPRPDADEWTDATPQDTPADAGADLTAADLPSLEGPHASAPDTAPSHDAQPDPLPEPAPDPTVQRIRRELYADDAPTAHAGLKTALWTLGSALLALLAAGQLTYHFRTDIAAAQPQLKPLLQQACARLGCTVPASHQPDKVSIEASELSPEPGNPPALRLSALLRNGADFEQAWPHLELTLTDSTDRAVVRRVLTPSEFLPPDADQAGFAPGSEQIVGVRVDPLQSDASGYRLYVFYP